MSVDSLDFISNSTGEVAIGEMNFATRVIKDATSKVSNSSFQILSPIRTIEKLDSNR